MGKNSLEKVLFIPDSHRPFHDKRAWKIALAVGEYVKPDTIIVMGDFADFYSVSSHLKTPSKNVRLFDEVGSVLEGLDELDALGAKKKIFICGNHEERLERYLKGQAPELFDFVAIPDLFELKQRGWRYIPYRDYYKLGKECIVTHDVGKSSKYAVRHSYEQTGTSTVIGHIHRVQSLVAGNVLEGGVHEAASFGWLGDYKAASEYMHRATWKRDWALGVGLGYVDSNGHAHLRPLPIVRYRCVAEGKLIVG